MTIIANGKKVNNPLENPLKASNEEGEGLLLNFKSLAETPKVNRLHTNKKTKDVS